MSGVDATQLRPVEPVGEPDELERIVAALSHDLREPVRSITGFTELLEREAQDDLSERGREFLRLIGQAGTRMDALLDALTRFARAGRDGATGGTTDLEAVLGRVRLALDERMGAAGALLTSGPLPVVAADPAAVQALLLELIGNAIKFADPPPPRVHVWAVRRGDRVELVVADAGPGIPERERERVFELFRRLHPRGSHPGVGVGLPICRRIAERQGGSIWIDDSPDGGTAVHVELAAGEDATPS